MTALRPIIITSEAREALLSLRSGPAIAEPLPDGQWRAFFHPLTIAGLLAQRHPWESYSETILRLTTAFREELLQAGLAAQAQEEGNAP